MTPDLRTEYLGLHLVSPFVPSASPLGADLDKLHRLEAAGAGAVVLPSLFEEQIEHDEVEMQRLGELWAHSFGEATGGFFPELVDYNTGPGSYLRHLEAAKATLSVPVVASLNGVSVGGWTRFATRMQEAGADALELNVYIMGADPRQPADAVERKYIDVVEEVVTAVSIPVAVKVGPYFSSMANMAARLIGAGASGLVLFNRFYQPDLDLDTGRVLPTLELSTSYEVRLPLRWIAILRPHIEASLAASSGVSGAADAIKLLMAGADVVQLASVLLRRGPEYLSTIIADTRRWLAENGYESLQGLRGSMSHANSPDPAGFERSNYLRVLTSFTTQIPPG